MRARGHDTRRREITIRDRRSRSAEEATRFFDERRIGDSRVTLLADRRQQGKDTPRDPFARCQRILRATLLPRLFLLDETIFALYIDLAKVGGLEGRDAYILMYISICNYVGAHVHEAAIHVPRYAVDVHKHSFHSSQLGVAPAVMADTYR